MAEKCYHFEIGDTDMGNAKSFISNSYLILKKKAVCIL